MGLFMNDDKCSRCMGRGKIEFSCTLCGDSTYDHICNDYDETCPDCDGTGMNSEVVKLRQENERLKDLYVEDMETLLNFSGSVGLQKANSLLLQVWVRSAYEGLADGHTTRFSGGKRILEGVFEYLFDVGLIDKYGEPCR